MNNYLIPANSKKSMLYFGLFNKFDLILFGIGLGTTLILLVTFKTSTFLATVLEILPLLVASFLVMPIPNYHNMMTVLINAFDFFTTNQRLVWKGWCVRGKEDK